MNKIRTKGCSLSEPLQDPALHPVDELIADLRALRNSAGNPPYLELALRIKQRRMERGASEAAARVSKSTVFDGFQLGRRRLNPDFLGELVMALGQDEAAAEEWKQRYEKARRFVPMPVIVAAPVQVPDEPEEAAEQSPASVPVASASRRAFALLLLACTLLNLFGGWLVMAMRLPLYLDMAGTAIASVVLGPWWGVLVAMGTNSGETVYDGRASLFFVIVNAAGALVWGYGVRRLGMGRTIGRFFALNAGVALVCTVVAVPVLLLYFHGVTRNADTAETLSLASTYHSLLRGLWSANMLTSLVDKMLCGVGVLIATSLLSAPLTTRLPKDWGAGMGDSGKMGVVRRSSMIVASVARA